jgi:mannose-6-phosphate isomerase-like protein (cupin superfamily)
MLKKIAPLALVLPFAVTPALAEQGQPGGTLAQAIGHYDPATAPERPKVHDGAGTMHFEQLLGNKALTTPLNFMHRGTIDPHSSIGQHFHNDCEEMFVILDGADAQFTINGRTAVVKTPAGVPDRRGSSHGVYNPSDKPIQWLNFNVGMTKGSSDAFNLGDTRVGAPLDPIPQFVNFHMDPALLKPVEHFHGGEGSVMYRRLLQPQVFFSTWSYADEISVPAGATIGATTDPGMSSAYYVISGAGTVTVNGQTVAIKAGDAIPVDLGQTHSFTQTGSEPLHMLEYGIAKDWDAKNRYILAQAEAMAAQMRARRQ